MERVIATISDGNKVLVQDVTAWVKMTTSSGGLRSWHGYFMLPQGAYMDVGGPYSFKTTDGRSGQILISNIGMGSHRATQVQFIGTGPFG